MSKDVIIACDFNSKADLMTFLDKFENEDRKPFLKVGMELFYAEGPAIVKEIKARGHKIFLDLKLHDIPNTVKKAMAVLSALDVDICNLHAAGTAGVPSPGQWVPKQVVPWLFPLSRGSITNSKKTMRHSLAAGAKSCYNSTKNPAGCAMVGGGNRCPKRSKSR